MSGPRVKIKGDKELIRKLKRLGSKTTAKKVLRSATTAGTNVLKKSLKAEVPTDTGALKRATATKVKAKDFKCYGIVGADRAYMGEDGAKPYKYDHLVNDGFQHYNGSTVAGAHYQEKGFESGKAAAEEAYAKKLAEGIEREALKGGT